MKPQSTGGLRENLNHLPGISLVVQWLRLCTPKAEDMGSVTGQGTKIPHAARYGQKKKIPCLLHHTREETESQRGERTGLGGGRRLLLTESWF